MKAPEKWEDREELGFHTTFRAVPPITGRQCYVRSEGRKESSSPVWGRSRLKRKVSELQRRNQQRSECLSQGWYVSKKFSL